MKKTRLIPILLAAMISVTSADLILTVNGLDTSIPVEVEPDNDIIIAVAGQTGEQKESFTVTCEMGGKLTPLHEPNSPTDESRKGDYLFTFEDEKLGVAEINLTVGAILDYQLVFFKVPDSNIIIFGMDSDAIEIPPPQPQIVSSQTALPASGGGGGTFYTMGAMDCNDVLDPNFYPNLNNISITTSLSISRILLFSQQTGRHREHHLPAILMIMEALISTI